MKHRILFVCLAGLLAACTPAKGDSQPITLGPLNFSAQVGQSVGGSFNLPSPPGVTAYAFSGQPAWLDITPSSGTLEPGQLTPISVRATCPATPGTLSGSVHITTTPLFRLSDLAVTLTCTAAPPTPNPSPSPNPAPSPTPSPTPAPNPPGPPPPPPPPVHPLVVSPDHLDFTDAASSSARILMVTRAGETASITPGAACAGVVSVSPGSGAAPGASFTVTPLAAGRCTLTFTSGDQSASVPITVTTTSVGVN